MSTDETLLIQTGRLVTCDPLQATDDNPLGASDDLSLVVKAGRVAAIGEVTHLAERFPEARVIDHRNGVVTPGLVDAHTHAVWVGSRGREYALRMAGADYEQISKAGGGIVASMRAVRAASLPELTEALAARLTRMAALGVTAVEVKSGYGLDEQSERRQLEAVARLGGRRDLPAVVPTFLGLHALPPEAQGDRDGHGARCLQWLEGIAADGLAAYVDAYVDRSAFSVAQARPLLQRAGQLGLGIRIHVGQFADVGGAEFAAELGAASVDHLENVSAAGAAALAEAGVRAVLLPVASFTLGQSPPPIALLREAGVELVVASDANPGTAPTESLPLAMALAVRNYGLTVAETLLGATRGAAASLGLSGGVLRAGGPADLVLWNLPHEADLIQPWGGPMAALVLRDGRPIAGALRAPA
ncbi:MAG: imidazolonepropionase [Deltaproteobacteria bacterium]|nr:MAG: imidazolonepropionase [Deltaproteobacteria bacterium]